MVLHDSTTEVLARINAYKREINYLRKSIRPTSRLNEIMKILNTFSAIFFPLTLIAGIYGSNFNWFAVMRRKKFKIKAREIPCSEIYWSYAARTTG